MNICGPLDVGDTKAIIATDPIPPADLMVSRQAALASPAFDGPRSMVSVPDDAQIHGDRTVVKLQHREHERLETVLRLESLRRSGIRAPRLLDTGTVQTASGQLWWAILERAVGSAADDPTPARQRALGAQLRAWHDCGPLGGLRLDEPGGLGVLLGTPRRYAPRAYPALAELFDAACTGQPMTAIHGDAAVGHNTLYVGDELTSILDPGAVDSGPPMLDLAWALAVDLPHDAGVGPLLEGYGPDAIDRNALDAVLPLMMVRRLIDTVDLGTTATDGKWLARWLGDHAPDLLTLVAPELEL